MFKQLFISLVALCLISFNVFAKDAVNPFAKKNSLNIGKDAAWNIDKKAVTAIKSSSDGKGTYYHLLFDNKQLKLSMSSDSAGASPKSFTQLEIKNLKIDGKQSPLFMWCLNNQERHKRFLQQGLKVAKGVCTIDGAAGSFVMRLNKDTLKSLREGSRLSFMLKPFRTQLELTYDISDFKDMYLALNAKPAPVIAAPVSVAPVAKIAKLKPARKCWAGPPPQYKNIKSVEYDCNDASAKLDAETWVTKLVNKEKEKQRKLAEEKKQKALAEKLKQEEKLQAEAAAIAASEAKQAEIGGEIAMKMVKVCEKYWNKGEHRCYCQKYIEHAPSSIQASSTCE